MARVAGRASLLGSLQQEHCKSSNRVTIVDLAASDSVINHGFGSCPDLRYGLRLSGLDCPLDTE